MNLDVPYYRLGNHEKVEYIPLKLALSDDVANEPQQQQFDETISKMPLNDMVAYDNTTSNVSMGIIILISIVAFVALFLLLYVIYYFVILRDQQYSDNIDTDSPFVFNKFD
ncbi:hypothetical protein [Thysanoplusia orichalcea nucleopolyhedrovirus]|uniref:Uncharacterized protein n=1 Tax=Thysanoplusia orichalcea nucleopolyhedrovirus TaxID=101850 RepID=L0CJS3_9ABAC|nr:hypothetical protein [Thysanoplusia orichalcea nucleopolyhedrovirus]AGA16229.1 hypothetical protein [Thysanoplusia orichalcea nucleopolyhedrovirus]